ncbi:uncharacterized protein K02A2.6-like [Ylistrum balloti]|uniref:uncharacterized protein K02A2.6-like n=1 Tax=Ylistrum balloti TaxID=509963 RepID=UPI002905AD82|nr:uncharacterized protein K02A2.6-like [Ylistrum balloti]
MRLRRFNPVAEHVPGKLLVVPDTLSRNPMKTQNDSRETAIEIFVNSIEQLRPISDMKLERIRDAQFNDAGVQKAIVYTKYGWPEKETCVDVPAREYFASRGELSVSNGLLLYRDRVVVPEELRKEIMENLQEGHMGIEKCRERARTTVWWPGLTKYIKAKVDSCQFCQDHKPTQRKEPLKNITSSQVILRLKNIFAHWGVPEEFVSDNGTQFASREFAEFAKEYGFRQTFSSPHYPQGNGEAESGVKTAKRILDQDDVFIALMAYRATPIVATGSSPSQLIMGRQIRTTVPVVEKKLVPKWPNAKNVRKRDTEYKRCYVYHYNRRHGVRDLPDLDIGDEVKVKLDGEKLWSAKGVVEEAYPEIRSYRVRTPKGVYQRNRRHLQTIAPDDVRITPTYDKLLSGDLNVTPRKTVPSAVSTPHVKSSTSTPPAPIVDKSTSPTDVSDNTYTSPKRLTKLPTRLKDYEVT